MKMKLASVVVAIATCAFANAEPPKGEGKGPKGPRGGGRAVPAEVLAKFDADKDGKLNAEERKTAMEARKAEMMKKFDKDGDGKLNEEERKAAGEARKAEMMKKFDKDGDGNLSDDEKAAMRKAMPARGDRRGRGKPGENGRKKGQAKRGGKRPAAE
ncbi:MAG: DnaJ-domain-containing protein 1 [Akkermansiaceae bacterium]|jgi:DnaJ-domain-containing protein 1